MLNLRFHVNDLGFSLPPNINARGTRPDPQRQEFFDLLQREPQVLSVLDEPQPLYSIFREDPVAGMRPGRRWQKAVPFVIADRFDVHPAFVGEFRRGESFHALSISLYCGTEFNPICLVSASVMRLMLTAARENRRRW